VANKWCPRLTIFSTNFLHIGVTIIKRETWIFAKKAQEQTVANKIYANIINELDLASSFTSKNSSALLILVPLPLTKSHQGNCIDM